MNQSWYQRKSSETGIPITRYKDIETVGIGYVLVDGARRAPSLWIDGTKVVSITPGTSRLENGRTKIISGLIEWHVTTWPDEWIDTIEKFIRRFQFHLQGRAWAKRKLKSKDSGRLCLERLIK